jgi:hypothetical protein
MIQVTIESADVTGFPCDALLLKYAQAFYGADAVVAAALGRAWQGGLEISPRPGKHVLLASRGAVAAGHVLFVGVVPLLNFSYSEIRAFAAHSLTVISEELPHARHVAMTIHGVSYGLDEREAFLAQLGGYLDAGRGRLSVERVSIVERDPRRADRLKAILGEAWGPAGVASSRRAPRGRRSESRRAPNRLPSRTCSSPCPSARSWRTFTSSASRAR